MSIEKKINKEIKWLTVSLGNIMYIMYRFNIVVGKKPVSPKKLILERCK